MKGGCFPNQTSKIRKQDIRDEIEACKINPAAQQFSGLYWSGLSLSLLGFKSIQISED
jgi:hypothetical protein